MKKSHQLKVVRILNETTSQAAGEKKPDEGVLIRPFQFSDGSLLDQVRIAYSLRGNPDGPLVAVLGGISANRHCSDSEGQEGWWNSMVGPGKSIDLATYRILSMDFLGGADASSSAKDLNERAGKEVAVSTFDQARALGMILDTLGIPRLDILIGASFGGMVGLAFCGSFPQRVGTLICISASHESVPQAIALREIQRRIVRLGAQSGQEKQALSLARQLAMVTYRTPDELNQRFQHGAASTDQPGSILGYLDYCGAKFSERFPLDSYLTLSGSLDQHRVDPATITSPVHLIGIDSDLLVPFHQLADLARQIKGPVYLHKLSSLYGHDAFLKEVFTFSQLIKSILEKQS